MPKVTKPKVSQTKKAKRQRTAVRDLKVREGAMRKISGGGGLTAGTQDAMK
jgi:hypothetical protein